MHRDLRPPNILVTSECTLKICDFGMARTIEVYEELDNCSHLKQRIFKRPLSPNCFHEKYCPPEVREDGSDYN
jgi:serine/threonine protein kinase